MINESLDGNNLSPPVSSIANKMKNEQEIQLGRKHQISKEMDNVAMVCFFLFSAFQGHLDVFPF